MSKPLIQHNILRIMEIEYEQAWDVLADDPEQLVEQVCEAYPKLVKKYLQNFCSICGQDFTSARKASIVLHKCVQDECMTDDYCSICGEEQ